MKSTPAAAISLQQGKAQYSLLLTNPLLRQLCEPVFRRVWAVIVRATKDRTHVRPTDDVILVGGSAHFEENFWNDDTEESDD